MIVSRRDRKGYEGNNGLDKRVDGVDLNLKQ